MCHCLQDCLYSGSRDPNCGGVPDRVPGQEADSDRHHRGGEVCQRVREADGDRMPATASVRVTTNRLQLPHSAALQGGGAGDLLQRTHAGVQADSGGDNFARTSAEVSAKVRDKIQPCEDNLEAVDDISNYAVDRSVIVPTVECEDVTDKRCVKLPSVEETDEEAQACVPVVDKPKCDKVGGCLKQKLRLVFLWWTRLM